MVVSLIRFDDKYISAAQPIMADDRVLEGFIHDMEKSAILEIHGHLQAAGFLHASHISRGYKLDLALISASVERWRPETNTFHLSCGDCAITLEDVVLQLDMPVDEPVIMGSAIVSGKVDICTSLLGKVLGKFEGRGIECDVDQWLPAPAVVVSLVATIVSTSQVQVAVINFAATAIPEGAAEDANVYIATDDDTDTNAHVVVNDNVDAKYISDVPDIWGTLWLHTYNDPNTACITVLQEWPIVTTIERRSEKYTMTGEDDATIDHGGR
ncbi:hypothetical protein J1N35_001482 [Gossypium stocksii]|uniref:Aminotransferase-like plant mobile domain-containing protein n=1 Tax=Gossypium stocksii TaxID=47602 RepID=A0A9D3WJ30_9ROSI|nr:hypothetical protein J1N35_001482 [Gossypium stocksii]